VPAIGIPTRRGHLLRNAASKIAILREIDNVMLDCNMHGELLVPAASGSGAMRKLEQQCN
jgi:hypothetical protein